MNLRLRAEAMADFRELLDGARECTPDGLHVQPHIKHDDETFEPVLTLAFESPDPVALEVFFEEFLKLFEELDDMHVAFETLAVPASAFTGMRDTDATPEGHMRAFRVALRAQA